MTPVRAETLATHDSPNTSGTDDSHGKSSTMARVGPDTAVALSTRGRSGT